MTNTNDQLTRPQLFGMLCLGICVWAIVIGVIYCVVERSFTGLIITGAGILGSVLLLVWLIWIAKGQKR
jgi:uncharacterized membrane protein YagU involved in acid resistance